jgi:hypothetical protein
MENSKWGGIYKIGGAAALGAMLGRLASMVWYILIARRLFQLGAGTQS